MNTCAMRVSGFLMLSLLLLCSTAHAVTMTVTLDGVSVNTCYSTWEEGSCVMQVVDTTMDDYTPSGNCTFFPQAEGIALMGARMEIDVSAVDGIDFIEVDLREVSGNGRTRVFLFEEDASNYFQFAMNYYDDGAEGTVVSSRTGSAPGLESVWRNQQVTGTLAITCANGLDSPEHHEHRRP